MTSTELPTTDNLISKSHFMPRPRLDAILEQATQGSLVYVIAGIGHGKTQTVRHFVEKQAGADFSQLNQQYSLNQRTTANVQGGSFYWLQLTENDNNSSQYWEKFTHTISMHYPDLAVRLRDLGFPDTLTLFKQFVRLIRSEKLNQGKVFFVLDDFHLIESAEVLTFVERFIHQQIPNICLIFISRKEPDINAVLLFSKGYGAIITEEEFRFTVAEVAEFFTKRGVPLSFNNISLVMATTKGWALALNMLSLILQKSSDNFQHALAAVSENLSKLIANEAWYDFPEEIQKSLVRFSLLSELPFVSMPEMVKHLEFWKQTPQLSSFIWFDSFTRDFKIHSLYLEFLREKQHLLSHEEKQETYQWAATWCYENKFYLGSIHYYAKARRFNRIIETLLAYPMKLSKSASEYILNVLESIEDDGGDRHVGGNQEQQAQELLYLKTFFIPLLLVGADRYEEAKEHSLATIAKWEQKDDSLATSLLQAAYSNLAYIDMYTCIVTHHYDSPKYLGKSLAYAKETSQVSRATSRAFINADLRAFACLVGVGADITAFDRFIAAVEQTGRYIEETRYSIYAGYSDLVACEYAFFQNKPEIARTYAHNAVIKASEKHQYSIVAMAEKYLLRIAMQEGNVMLVRELLKQLHQHLDNSDFWNRQLYFDLYVGAFYVQLGLLEEVPHWFAMADQEIASEIHIPARELYVRALYYIAAKKYQQALTILCSSYPREPYERFLFGELRFLILTAVARLQTGDTAGAVADFAKAYELSFQGFFELFFIEMGKELQPLVLATLEQADSQIPKEWLKVISRKASIYAKKVLVVTNALSPKSREAISLSNREKGILLDLYHGLSRDEIAENQYLSINTVKTVLQSIYTKLDASNSVDAIRIALENKLIE